eukprot:jgi/Bigna1/50099/estExt_Genewise1.C_670001
MPEESIYDLIPKPVSASKKTVRYKSKFNPKMPPSYSTFGRGARGQHTTSNVGGDMQSNKSSKAKGSTFGPTTKHQKFTYTDRRKPGLSMKLEKRAIPKKEKKNFITQNAVDAIMKVTRKPEKKDVRFVKKAEYGKVPGYLKEVKADIQAEREFIEQMLERSKEEEDTQPKNRVMDEAEKEELLDALKMKWGEVNEKYQKISHVVKLDTIGKKRRKEQYEKELTELDQAIQKLSRGTVFIADE